MIVPEPGLSHEHPNSGMNFRVGSFGKGAKGSIVTVQREADLEARSMSAPRSSIQHGGSNSDSGHFGGSRDGQLRSGVISSVVAVARGHRRRTGMIGQRAKGLVSQSQEKLEYANSPSPLGT